MHEFVSFNHQILDASKTNFPAISSAVFYGRGIFTTIAIYDSKPFLWEKHWSRLKDNAFRIGLNFKFSEELVTQSLFAIIKHNKLKKGRARITFSDESAKGIWSIENNKETSILITTDELRPLPDKLRANISPYQINSTSPLANIKSCNYLENLLALEKARHQGFDEAIRLNEKGEIASACMANVFWVKGDDIFTPSLETGCLAGTMREFILEKHKVFEVEAQLESLQKADGVFLTSSGLGARQIFFGENQVNPLKIIDLLQFDK